jgi:uncharacterized protein (TIGR00369 family)
MKGNDAPSQERLKAAPGVTVRYLNLARTGGILHAKYLLLDDELLYVGSQNFDWRSLTQIHELGVRVRSRPLASQLGAIFALADSAFGLASNSHGPVAAGIDAHITFQATVAAGDSLVARAVEVHRNRRIGVYRIDVVREDAGGETAVSSFTGTVYVKG